MSTDVEDDEESRKKVMFFGEDLNSMPCFRQTMLTSISSGLIVGFAYFMLTSRSRRAVHIGYGTFFFVTFGFWIHCRYNFAYRKQQAQQLQAAAQNMVVVEGTEGELATKVDR